MVKKISAMQILVCLGVSLFSAVTGLAAETRREIPMHDGGRAVVITTHGRRLTVASRPGSKFVTASFQPPIGSVKYFDNLSRYKRATYFCCLAYSISGSGFILGSAAAAISFRPKTSGEITSIAAGLSYFGGTNSATISINNDAAGLPGTSVATFTVTNLPPFAGCCVLSTVKVSPPVPVSKGTRYWIVVESSVSQTDDTNASWNNNTTDMRAHPVAVQTDGTWALDHGALPALGVFGH